MIGIDLLRRGDPSADPRATVIERAPLPDGAEVVATVPFALTHRLLREVMATRGCLTVTGIGGSGKTFCVDDFFTGLDADVVKLHLEGTVRGYGFLRRLVRALGGRDAGDGEELMRSLREAVGSRRVWVYVDEANNLNKDSLRQIRYLRDQRDLHLVFVLVGTDFRAAYRLVPELWSRVTRRVTFNPLQGDALFGALAAYHPFLAAADPDLLARIDDEHCHGNWRVWSEVLPLLVDYAARLGTGLTRDVAASVLGVTVDPQVARAARGSKARTGRRPR